MSLTCSTTITMSVTVLFAVSKMGVILHNRQYCWNILLSEQILDAMKRVTDGNFVFQ